MSRWFGIALAGFVDEWKEQYAATRFFHVAGLPLFPVGAVWVATEDDRNLSGHRMRLSGRSVLAGYLRAWGIAAAAFTVALAGLHYLAAREPRLLLAGVGAAAACLAVALLSWRWAHVAPAESCERELFGAVSGTFCNPDLIPPRLTAVLYEQLQAQWELRYPDRTVLAVADGGARDTRQAAHAYALLRLAAQRAAGRHVRELCGLARRLAAAWSNRGGFRAGEGPFARPAKATPAQVSRA